MTQYPTQETTRTWNGLPADLTLFHDPCTITSPVSDPNIKMSGAKGGTARSSECF